jgi:hypothetical protein
MENEQNRDFDKVKDIIVGSLTDLIKINSERTRELVSRFLKASEKNIVVKLQAYPELQLEYIEHVLRDREEGKKIDNEVLTIHIQLLCQQHPHRILQEVQKWDYPLDEALRLCKQHGVMDATAYLLERTGAIEEALAMHVRILYCLCDDFLLFLEQSPE